jgi:glycosyltransferase involved in cell wall biosynthesis
MERRSFAAARLVVFANDGYRARAVCEGLLQGDCEVVPNGWSLPSVPPDQRWRAGSDRLLAYVGTISERDNVDHLIDTLSLLQPRRSVRMVVAGSGSALASVKQQARERHLAGSVEWLGLVKERARLPQTEALAGETIRFSPDMTAEGLAAAIEGLLEAPGERRALGEAARRRFEERISWERVGARRLVAGYERLFG